MGSVFGDFNVPVNRVLYRAQELCESRGGRPGLPSLISLRFQNCGGKATLGQPSNSALNKSNDNIGVRSFSCLWLYIVSLPERPRS